MSNLNPQIIIQVSKYAKAAKSQQSLLTYCVGFNIGLFTGLYPFNGDLDVFNIILSVMGCISFLKLRGVYISHKYRVVIELLKSKQN